MEINKKRVAGKWTCLVGLALVLSFSLTLLFGGSASAAMIPFSVKTTKDALNIRVKADTTSDILTVIETTGTALYPVSETGNWYRIRFANNLYGYVFKDYVVTGDACPTTISLFPGAALRTAASAGAQIQTICSTNTKVSVSSQDDTWYYVTAFNGEQGYILKTSVAEPAPAYPVIKGREVEVTLDTLVQVTSSTANIRSGPSTSYGKVATVSAGTILTVVSQTNGSDGYVWYKITTSGGTEGYIRSDLVKSYDSTSALKGKVIVLDAGHGSYKSETSTETDDGNVGPTGLLEKDVNLEVALYLEAYLKASGATVIMTRSTDVGVLLLTTRAQVANDHNADAFLSIHCNASTTDTGKKGAITYYFSGSTGNPVSASLVTQRKALAADVNNALVAETGADNLGTDNMNFTILVASNMPSAFVEVGFNYQSRRGKAPGHHGLSKSLRQRDL